MVFFLVTFTLFLWIRYEVENVIKSKYPDAIIRKINIGADKLLGKSTHIYFVLGNELDESKIKFFDINPETYESF